MSPARLRVGGVQQRQALPGPSAPHAARWELHPSHLLLLDGVHARPPVRLGHGQLAALERHHIDAVCVLEQERPHDGAGSPANQGIQGDRKWVAVARRGAQGAVQMPPNALPALQMVLGSAACAFCGRERLDCCGLPGARGPTAHPLPQAAHRCGLLTRSKASSGHEQPTASTVAFMARGTGGPVTAVLITTRAENAV